MKQPWLFATALALCMGWGTAASAEKPIELTFSTYLPPAYEYVWKPIEHFVDTVHKESNGRVRIKVFHSGQLFDGYEELPALSRGDVDIVNMTGTYLSGTLPATNIFTLPFLFQDVPHLQRALEAGLLDLGITKELATQHDAIVLGVAPFDPYEFYSRRNPILSADDFKGKVWATTGAVDARAIQLLGGSPTGMPSSELYLAFDRGVIDGTPRPLLTGIGRSLFEVTKHLSLANFGVDTSILSINRKKWESLPPDIQEILKKAAKQRDDDQFARVAAFVKEAVATYEAKGVKVHRIEGKNLQAMRDATAGSITEWAAQVPDGNRYLEIIEKTKNQ
ncbi:TRAP transporter substrate-binding protein DctP [Pollutimonas bauzanensis]|uniref:TRAP-type C4-dicarboxylate transport system, substrate-binding protein n=1 Tax=Pollutimonas bauzanensis TaxID=658167 RepID=A0A1M5Z0L7_9BURK|nr:TRAP transporter substrate-binding protein DctP [Pollutimonas bauzanensis]SHI17817.1 TRAP-type C4-dicarboxylate transport system, substrate-binding protein [Pollutimonas bauzanensis]